MSRNFWTRVKITMKLVEKFEAMETACFSLDFCLLIFNIHQRILPIAITAVLVVILFFHLLIEVFL